MSRTEYELASRLLVQDRGASEAEDARSVPAPAPMPQLTAEQAAAVDDMAGLV